MRDIGNRIGRYRLGRYAPPDNPRSRRLRWILAALLVWLAWASFGSEHSFLRLWRLEQEHRQAQQDLETARQEQERLDHHDDPAAQRAMYERSLRENSGMARPDEIVYRVKSATPDSGRTAPQTSR